MGISAHEIRIEVKTAYLADESRILLPTLGVSHLSGPRRLSMCCLELRILQQRCTHNTSRSMQHLLHS